MVRKIKLSEATANTNDLISSIKSNAESILRDIEDIKGCKFDSEAVRLLKAVKKDIIDARSGMSGVRTSCSAKYGESVKRKCVSESIAKRSATEIFDDMLTTTQFVLSDIGDGTYEVIDRQGVSNLADNDAHPLRTGEDALETFSGVAEDYYVSDLVDEAEEPYYEDAFVGESIPEDMFGWVDWFEAHKDDPKAKKFIDNHYGEFEVLELFVNDRGNEINLAEIATASVQESLLHTNDLSEDNLEYSMEKYVGKPVEEARKFLNDLGFDMFVMAGPSKRNDTWEEYTSDGDNPGSLSVKLYFDLVPDSRDPRRKKNGKLTEFSVFRYE